MSLLFGALSVVAISFVITLIVTTLSKLEHTSADIFVMGIILIMVVLSAKSFL